MIRNRDLIQNRKKNVQEINNRIKFVYSKHKKFSEKKNLSDQRKIKNQL